MPHPHHDLSKALRGLLRRNPGNWIELETPLGIRTDNRIGNQNRPQIERTAVFALSLQQKATDLAGRSLSCPGEQLLSHFIFQDP